MPEHLKKVTTPHVGHPGCFSTAILLASVPLLSSGIAEPTLFVSGVTGSTGSGRKPVVDAVADLIAATCERLQAGETVSAVRRPQ